MNIFFITIVVSSLVQISQQHGRMLEPPARNTMWRLGYSATPNYEDSELFCGGIVNQWTINKGRCGICGDSYSLVTPRPYETGGKYVTNETTRTYAPKSKIDVIIQLVANHLGTFKFSICPRNSLDQAEKEECFIPLKVNGEEKYELKTHRKGIFAVSVELPSNLTCQHCVFRWHWKSANNWGHCDDGKEAVGCGPQETYRNCADIAVSHDNGIKGSGFKKVEQKSGQIVEHNEQINDDYYPTHHRIQKKSKN